MADDTKAPEPFSLSRWSRRKLAAARPAPAEAAVPVAAPVAPTAVAASESTNAAASEPAALPPVESLTIDSDFSAFMQPKVDEDVKRAAIKKLFSDPQFNVMDGLDTYTGDYTQPDPMPAGMLDKLANVYGVLTRDEDEAAEATGDRVAAAEPPPLAPPDAALPPATGSLPPLANEPSPAHAAPLTTPSEAEPVAVHENKQA
jgi:hypothetical protein